MREKLATKRYNTYQIKTPAGHGVLVCCRYRDTQHKEEKDGEDHPDPDYPVSKKHFKDKVYP